MKAGSLHIVPSPRVPGLPYQGCPLLETYENLRGSGMSKRIRKSTQIRQARKEAANRKRTAFEFQRPEPKRRGLQAVKGLST